jgi:hypothetical protein
LVATHSSLSWKEAVSAGYREGDKLATWKDYDQDYLKPGNAGFPEYAKMDKQRLAIYEFTLTFQLDEENLTRQGKLTTWIEYLSYEYYWHDGAEDRAKAIERQNSQNWKQLV